MLPASAGSYAIGRPLGRGGVASVFASVDASGRPVAIKLLGAEVGGDEAALSRFRREVDALSRLRHPNVLPLLDSGFDPSCGPYLVTPLIEGKTGRQLFGDVASPEMAALFGAALAHGITAVHEAGLVHRDLKPENVMITPRGGVILIDFGLAVHPAHSRHTREGAVAGSVPYMSPEQIAGDGVSAASDVWSLGVVLYEWASGQRPFYRPRQQEEVAAILAGRVTPLDGTTRRASRRLSEMVAACLSTQPGGRPRALEVARALEIELDWFEPDARDRELGAAASDPAGYPASAAPRIAEVIAARVKGAGLDPFNAMRELDRALAYQPDDAALAALASEAMVAPRSAAPSQPPPVGNPSGGSIVAAPVVAPPASRRGLWLALALVGTAALAGVFGFLMAGGGGRGFKLDQSDPVSVVQAIFEAAKNDDTSMLPGLCDPEGENDGDTRDICMMRVGSPRWPEFKSIFSASAIDGPPRIGGMGAEVDFYFGGGRRETMKLVRRATGFYLASF